MARVRVTNGTEGARHDPYGWTEIQFTKTCGTVVTLRSGGLGYTRLHVDGTEVAEGYFEEGAAVWQQFQALTGMSGWRAMQVPDMLEHRALRRMPPAERWAAQACMEADRRMLAYAV